VAEKIKIEIKKKKKRVPLPQKPPKVISTKKTYNRKKEKQSAQEESVTTK
jgi:hypothetical protein